jgi:predicted anti-sigma-YlaC factor YlaD
MTCSEFVIRFSEYYDGTASGAYLREAEAHLTGCPSCREYRHVVERGVQLLQTLPTPTIRDDFRPRLQHRLYHVDQVVSLRRHTSSGTTALAVAVIAVLLTVVAWSPALRPSVPVVELAPIVVSGPPPLATFGPFPGFADLGLGAAVRSGRGTPGLWDDAHALLYQYSRLSQRYRRSAPLQRVSLDEDR